MACTLCSWAGRGVCSTWIGALTVAVAVGFSAVHGWAGGPRMCGGGSGRSGGATESVAATLCSAGVVSRIGAKGLKTRAISVSDSTAVAVAAANGKRSASGTWTDEDSALSVVVRSVSCARSSSAVLEPGILQVVGNHARLSERRSALVLEVWTRKVR